MIFSDQWLAGCRKKSQSEGSIRCRRDYSGQKVEPLLEKSATGIAVLFHIPIVAHFDLKQVCRQTRCRSFSPFPTCCSFFWSFSTALSGCQVTVSDQRWVLSCQTPNFLWTGSPLWLMFPWRCSRRRTGRWRDSGEWQHGSHKVNGVVTVSGEAL